MKFTKKEFVGYGVPDAPKKHYFTKALSLMLAIAMLFSITAGIDISAYAEIDEDGCGDYEYEILDDGTVEITDYNGSDSIVSIPSTIDGKQVTSIGRNAFCYCDSLSIIIPDSIMNIDDEAFNYCDNLANITVDSNNKNYSSENGVLYNKSKTELILYPEGKTDTSFTIPNSVTNIGDCAFSWCKSLSNVSIPDSVTSIGYCAFSGCTNLTNVTIPKNVTSISEGLFQYCESLTNITISDRITNIEGYVFHGCTRLTSITVDSNNKNYLSENGVLYNKNKTELIRYPEGKTLESFTIPNSVTSIDECAFYQCYYLVSVAIPNSITKIEEFTFGGCNNLASIIIPDSVTSIGDFAFVRCYRLLSVTIGNQVTSIGDSAFCDCYSLASITIPNSVTSIGKEAFERCEDLTSITIGNGIKEIYSSLFDDTAYYNNQSNWTNGVLYIDNYLIKAYGETVSDTYTVKDGTTVIAGGAFSDCNNLTSITIPKSVTGIDDYAFDYWNDGFVIYCHYGSYAQKYAEEHGANYKFISNAGIETVYTYETKTITFSYDCQKNYLLFTPTENGRYILKFTGNGYSNIYDSNMNRIEEIEDDNDWNDYFLLTKGETYYIISEAYDFPLSCNVAIELKHEHKYSNDKCSICGKSAYEYDFLDNGTIEITEYKGSASIVVIPSTIDGKTVTSIGGFAFEYCSSLTSVTIPNSVTNIGEGAFFDCGNLSSVSIPDSVTSIDYCAFEYCESLTSITIPKSVKRIYENVFDHCYSLSNIYYNGTVKEWNEIRIEDENIGLMNATIHCTDGVINEKCKNHSWNNGQVTKKATCKATGVKTYTCTKCGETKTESIAKTNTHTYKTTTTKATTKKNGNVVKKCSVCGASTKTTIYSPKTITLSKTSYVYNGKVQKPTATIKDSKGKKIAASNYTVTYTSGRKNVGKYNVTIKFKGNYSGTVTKTFTIKPKATTLSSVTAKSKGFTVKWKKLTTQTTGYQIQYSTDKNFKRNNKSVTVSKNKTTSKSISKLKAKKKYYVRIRTYKTVGKTKIYSAWSKSKAVTTKK